MRMVAFIATALLFIHPALADQLREPAATTLASIAPVAPAADLVRPSEPSPRPSLETMVVVVGGDLGFSGDDQPVASDGARRHGARMPFADMTRHIAPLLVGDVVFANLETVLTDRNDLASVEKLFNFRSHPAGLLHMVGLGLNVVSLANNHAFDHGVPGLRESLHHVGVLRAAGLAAAPGVGASRRESLAPGVVERGATRVLVSALGIGPGGHGDGGADRPGMASWNNAKDYADALTALTGTPGDLRMLSVHYGQELQLRPSAGDERRLRDAVEHHGVDLVVGHHAHVAGGVQSIGGRLIFYGLGNLLHPGMQDMARHGLCRDYGVIARVHYARRDGEPFMARAIEVVTLEAMHAAPRPRVGAAGRARIDVLNHLAEGLDRSDGARGVRFTALADGRGLYCSAGAGALEGTIGDLCRSATVAFSEPPARAASCTHDQVARRVTTGSPISGARAAHASPRRLDTTAHVSADAWAR